MPTRASSIEVKPFSVRLNFHGDLDFFLPSRSRHKSVERNLTEKTSIKDVVESCGVPHPEVGLILINGTALGLNCCLTRDAEVDVYPPGKGYTLSEEKHHQMPTKLSFVADGHLGKLTRNLRLLGFDVAYDCRADDRQLLRIMEAENRALITRDRRLLMHAIVTAGYCPRSQDPHEQTIELIRRFDLSDLIAPFTRCLRCNSTLQETAKADIVERLEPLTKIYYEQFRRCTGCGQIYWSGSHFGRLQKLIDIIRARLAEKTSV